MARGAETLWYPVICLPVRVNGHTRITWTGCCARLIFRPKNILKDEICDGQSSLGNPAEAQMILDGIECSLFGMLGRDEISSLWQ
jgi:hypothetical protein